MKRCDCGRSSMFIRTEQRGAVAVDLFECRQCGEWEDYRFQTTPTLTPTVLAARHECFKAQERVRARQRYHRRKAQVVP